jgi:hypothetical protein
LGNLTSGADQVRDTWGQDKFIAQYCHSTDGANIISQNGAAYLNANAELRKVADQKGSQSQDRLKRKMPSFED